MYGIQYFDKTCGREGLYRKQFIPKGTFSYVVILRKGENHYTNCRDGPGAPVKKDKSSDSHVRLMRTTRDFWRKHHCFYVRFKQTRYSEKISEFWSPSSADTYLGRDPAKRKMNKFLVIVMVALLSISFFGMSVNSMPWGTVRTTFPRFPYHYGTYQFSSVSETQFSSYKTDLRKTSGRSQTDGGI